MSFPPIIDVAIGLIFVYLLLGLITTAIQELVVSYLSYRGKMLRDAIASLVANGDKTSQIFSSIFNHPLIVSSSASKLPSYLPSRTFALVVIDALSEGGSLPIFSQVERGLSALPAGAARDSLTLLVQDAAGDMDALNASIATWFDDAMDRVSGVYKRHSQAFALVLGAIVAIALNVDSVNLANRLWSDQALRNSAVTAAQAFSDTQHSAAATGGSAQPPDVDQAQKALTQNVAALNQLSLPIGWVGVFNCPAVDKKKAASVPTAGNNASNPGDPCTKLSEMHNPPAAGSWSYSFWMAWAYLWHLGIGGVLLLFFGWAITAAATSLGAPFWFGILQNVLNLRGAGPKPARADGTGGDS